MPAALASVLNKVRKLEADVAAEYAAMVRTVAGDREVEVGELLDTIGAAGRTREDFERDVERLAARIQARALFDQLDARRAARDKGERKLAAVTRQADEELGRVKAEAKAMVARAEQARAEKVGAADAERQRLHELAVEAQNARDLLLETAPPDLARRRADLARRRDEARAAAEKELPALRARLARIDELLEGGVPPERNETTHPYGGTPLMVERARMTEDRERRARIIQVRNLEEERARLLPRIAELEAAPDEWAAAAAAAEVEMLAP